MLEVSFVLYNKYQSNKNQLENGFCVETDHTGAEHSHYSESRVSQRHPIDGLFATRPTQTHSHNKQETPTSVQPALTIWESTDGKTTGFVLGHKI